MYRISMPNIVYFFLVRVAMAAIARKLMIHEINPRASPLIAGPKYRSAEACSVIVRSSGRSSVWRAFM